MIVFADDRSDDRNERRRRAVDLILRAAEERAHEPGDRAADDPLLRAQPRGHGEAHGEGNGYERHDEPRGEITQDLEMDVPPSEILVATVDGGQKEQEPLGEALLSGAQALFRCQHETLPPYRVKGRAARKGATTRQRG